MNLHAILVFICTSGLLLRGLSAHEVPGVVNFTKEQYQAQNQNWAIAQAPDHLIYAANNAGLLQFDGSAWTTYLLPHRQVVRAVACGPGGQVFTGGFGEFGYWEPDSIGRFRYHSLSKNLNFELAAKEEIWHILVQEKEVWFQSFSTIYKYDYQTLRIITPPSPYSILFLQEVRGRLYLQAKGKGLLELSSKGIFYDIPGSEFLAGSEVVAILPHGAEALLICTSHEGLFLYENGRFRPWNCEGNSLFKVNQLNKCLRLLSGDYAFGTILNGVYILNETGDIRFHLNKENSLQNNTVLSMYEGDQGNLWLGLDRGIDLVVLSSPLRFFGDKSGRIGTVYAAALFEGDLYVGTNQGVFRQKGYPGRFDSGNAFQLIKGTQGQVWELNVFDGELLCGHNDGAFVIRGEQIRKVSAVTGGWNTIEWQGRKDLLLQGTYTGLVVLEKDGAQGWRLAHRVSGFSEPVNRVCLDAEGYVWALNPYKGLHRLRLSADLKNIVEQRSFDEDNGLPSAYNLDLVQVGDRVLIQSDSLFSMWDPKADQFVAIDSINGILPAKGSYKFVPVNEDEGFLLYADHILYRSATREESLHLSLNLKYKMIIPLAPSTYLFCLDEGYAIFNPQDVPAPMPQLPVPAPLIRAVELMGEREMTVYACPNRQAARTIALRAQQNDLRFRFALPYYTEKARFRHRLEGFSSRWSEWSDQAIKEFTNLAPGEYVFSVQSDISPHTTALHFSIASQWYETVWARVLYVSFFLLLAYLFYRFQQYRLERHRRRLEIEKARELQQQMIRARNEQLQLDVENKSKELANSTMNLIRKNEILLKVKEELKKLRAESDAASLHVNDKRLLRLIDANISDQHDWKVFETHFTRVHDRFFKQLKADFPDLTGGDLRMAAYLKMNLSSKEIAPLLNISVRGVENKRYRLRKKLNLDHEGSLVDLLMRY